MPIIKQSGGIQEKKRAFSVQGKPAVNNDGRGGNENGPKAFLSVAPAPALPVLHGGCRPPRLSRRSHSSVSLAGARNSGNGVAVVAVGESSEAGDRVSTDSAYFQATHEADGRVQITRTQKEKEKNPDRISLDRRGLTAVPLMPGESRIRLLSLQHNLISRLDSLSAAGLSLSRLVFLDIYDNQVDKISGLESLDNLRVLLMGKNRIRKIEGLRKQTRLEVLDLHGNQINSISGLTALIELKVLNLAGNQIRCVGASDLQGLRSLQELNLRRNRLKKLLGFGETPHLFKLFLSNNELACVEDMYSVAKAGKLREVAIDGNPVSQAGDCVSFLVSYLPNLVTLSNMQITDPVRKAALAWRSNKEVSSTLFQQLGAEPDPSSQSVAKREEVIFNARTNWELLRSQSTSLGSSLRSIPDCELLESLDGAGAGDGMPGAGSGHPVRGKSAKAGNLARRRGYMRRTASQDTDVSQGTSSTNTSNSLEFFRLPPILVPLLGFPEEKNVASPLLNGSEAEGTPGQMAAPPSHKRCDSLSSVEPNVDSSLSSLPSDSSGADDSDDSSAENHAPVAVLEPPATELHRTKSATPHRKPSPTYKPLTRALSARSKSNRPILQSAASFSAPTPTPAPLSQTSSSPVTPPQPQAPAGKTREQGMPCDAANAKPASTGPPLSQVPPPVPVPGPTTASNGDPANYGGDYLVEISGRYLNVYGQGALRFVDRPWNTMKAADVTIVKFNYINFNGLTMVLGRLKQRFPNAEHFIFRETNISCLGQLNALADIQGLTSLYIEEEGNPIASKDWQSYAIYRLAHWGLRTINDKEVTEEMVAAATAEYRGLSDLVLWSLPDSLLQPLLSRLRLDGTRNAQLSARQWLWSADPALRSVVGKEALQWRRTTLTSEDLAWRSKGRVQLGALLEMAVTAVQKLRQLESEWPNALQELVRDTLVDYSHLHVYMKKCMNSLQRM